MAKQQPCSALFQPNALFKLNYPILNHTHSFCDISQSTVHIVCVIYFNPRVHYSLYIPGNRKTGLALISFNKFLSFVWGWNITLVVYVWTKFYLQPVAEPTNGRIVILLTPPGCRSFPQEGLPYLKAEIVIYADHTFPQEDLTSKDTLGVQCKRSLQKMIWP